jgi:uncharacterized protein YbbC (DUF1343 family)
MLEACAEAGVEVLVTDRPIPLPHIVDGPMLDPRVASFVAPCPLPMVYGMTPAETALWMQKKLNLDLNLSVVPMEGWARGIRSGFNTPYPTWMPPSPGIKTIESAITYAATVFSEGLPGIDCGRGTNLAFRVFGAPWIKAEACCEVLNSTVWHEFRMPGNISFHPYRYMAGVAPYLGRELDGIRITVTCHSSWDFRPVRLSAIILKVLAEQYGANRVWRHKGVRPEWFDKLYGTSHTRDALKSGMPLDQLFSTWDSDSKIFLRERKRVLLYK